MLKPEMGGFHTPAVATSCARASSSSRYNTLQAIMTPWSALCWLNWRELTVCAVALRLKVIGTLSPSAMKNCWYVCHMGANAMNCRTLNSS